MKNVDRNITAEVFFGLRWSAGSPKIILQIPTFRVDENTITLFSCSETRINRTLKFLLKALDANTFPDDLTSSFGADLKKEEFLDLWSNMFQPLSEIDAIFRSC